MNENSQRQEQRGEFLAGAVKRPDGTLDTSKAASFNDPNLQAAIEQKDTDEAAAKAEKWKKTMEVPADVKPGTASMVWDKLRRSIALNEKMLAEEPENGPNVIRLGSRIESFRVQQAIIDRVIVKAIEALQKPANDISAAEMNDPLEAFKKDLQEILDENKKAYLDRGGKEEEYENSKGLDILARQRELKEAEELQVKMTQEALGS